MLDDTFGRLSVTLIIRTGVKCESDKVGDDIAAAVQLDCRGAAAHVFFLFNHFFIFDYFFRLLISIIDDGGVSAVILT